MNADVWIICAVAAAGLLYANGLRSICARGAFGRVLDIRAVSAFLLGLAATFAVTAPVFERLSEKLFSAHMAQHLTLMLVCAPLLATGRPAAALLWAFPRRVRPRITRVWRSRGLVGLRALIASAPASWLWFIALFAFWHLPGPYAYALRHEEAHIAEHLFLLSSAYGFWAVAFGSLCGLSPGGRILFVTSAALVSALPGALISLSMRPFYAIHAASARLAGLSPLEDQQLAGLVMWIPAGFFYLAVILGLLFLWMRDAERRQVARRGGPLFLVLLGAGFSLSGCSDMGGPTLATAAFGNVPGDPARGARDMENIGCGSCHTIPGIAGARGLVGPPLDHMARRIYVAGFLRNTPEQLARWVREPQAILPGNAMPDMGLTEDQSRDIAAYLFTLR